MVYGFMDLFTKYQGGKTLEIILWKQLIVPTDQGRVL